MLSPEEFEERRRELEERRRQKRDMRRKRTAFYLLCTALGLILLLAAAYWSYSSRLPWVARGGNPNVTNVLMLGVDSGVGDGSRSDTMIVFSVDKGTGGLSAIAIPRDTRALVPGRGYERVNAAHAIGGPKLAVRTVENLLGISIDYYVRIDFQGFETLVDMLGGVVIDVEKAMAYEDRAQGLKIDLQPGLQLLDGNKALQYVRFRADGMGDVALVDAAAGEYAGRVERQLKFVRALLNQALSTKNLLNAPQLANEMRHAVESNMPVAEALRLVMAVKDIRSHEIKTAILPGMGETVGGASYWVADAARTQELVNKMIVRRDAMVRVEVLNGSGISGAAAHAADELRKRGFEVVAVGNADHFAYARTSVIPRGDVVLAEQVARALGGEVAPESARPTVASDADVTVILGKDFAI